MIPIGFVLIIVTAIISYTGFNNISIFEKYKFNIYKIRTQKEYIRFFSSGFLHADWSHLIFNMISLYFFQKIVQEAFGVVGFLIIYFGSMFLGNLFTYLLYKNQPNYSAIGASGAVSGIIFAAIALVPAGIKINFLPGWLFGTLYFGYSVYMMLNPKQWDNLGHSAHIGGAVFGLFVTLVIYPAQIIHNIMYIGIMAVPLIYLAFRLLKNK